MCTGFESLTNCSLFRNSKFILSTGKNSSPWSWWLSKYFSENSLRLQKSKSQCLWFRWRRCWGLFLIGDGRTPLYLIIFDQYYFSCRQKYQWTIKRYWVAILRVNSINLYGLQRKRKFEIYYDLVIFLHGELTTL